MIKAVIFDLDGTLTDTLKSIAFTTNEVLRECGYKDRELNEYRYFVGDGADTLIERALLACGDKELVNYEDALKRYIELFPKYCTMEVKPYEGIKETLSAMKEMGYKLAVLSNKDDDRVKNVVDMYFEKDTFDIVRGRRKGVPKKPDKAGLVNIMKEFEVEPWECMYCGDTNVDMMTGKSAGAFTVGVLWGFRDEEELRSNNADEIVSNPKELLDILKKN